MVKIPLYKPFIPKLTNIDLVLNSGKLAYGKYGKELESRLGNYIGNSLFLVTNNYSNAVLLALLTLGIKKGDKVVISPLICLATSQPISALGAEVVFCDVSLKNGGLDSQMLDDILSSQRISCVVLTHYAGIPADIEEVGKVCKIHGVPVIEDGSDAFGAKYQDKFIGNVGFDVSIFSFSAVRNPNLIDAGGISFHSRNLFERAYLIRDAGINRENFRNSIGEIDLSSDVYLPGISATLDELRSYIGLKQLEVLENLLETNKMNSLEILSRIKKLNLNKKYLIEDFGVSNGWVLPIKSKHKNKLINLLKDSNITASSVHGNISNYSIYNNSMKMINSDIFLSHFLAIPCGWWIEDLNDFIINLIKAFKDSHDDEF
jgi:perosamine synthetase